MIWSRQFYVLVTSLNLVFVFGQELYLLFEPSLNLLLEFGLAQVFGFGLAILFGFGLSFYYFRFGLALLYQFMFSLSKINQSSFSKESATLLHSISKAREGGGFSLSWYVAPRGIYRTTRCNGLSLKIHTLARLSAFLTSLHLACGPAATNRITFLGCQGGPCWVAHRQKCGLVDKPLERGKSA